MFVELDVQMMVKTERKSFFISDLRRRRFTCWDRGQDADRHRRNSVTPLIIKAVGSVFCENFLSNFDVYEKRCLT